MDMQEASARMKINNCLVDEESKAYFRMKLNECYEGIIDTHKRYMDMPESQIKFIAVWDIGTYWHHLFNSYPYLFFNAMRGSGKTRLLKLTSTFCAGGDGSVQNNITEAVLFRSKVGKIMCIDEIEQIGGKEKQTLRELLNSAYKKGSIVQRMQKKVTKDGESQETQTFRPYFPVAMANIWGMDEVLGDRSIPLILEKSDKPGVTKKIEDFQNVTKIKAIPSLLSDLVPFGDVTLCKKTYIEAWNDYIDEKYNNTTTTTHTTTHNNTTTPEELERNEFFNKIDNLGISGRNFELLFPLLIIAKELGDEVFNEISRIGSEIIQTKKEDEYTNSKDVSLFEFVLSLESFGLEYIPVKEITSRFRDFVGEEDPNDKWLNEKWMGNALKRLNLVLYKKKMSAGRQVILDFAKAREKLKIFKSDSVSREGI